MAKIVSRGDPIEPAYLNNLRQCARGWGVVSGLAVSQRGAGANMSVDVAAGYAIINNVEAVKGSTTNVAITAAHASYVRYDLVVINSSGTISVIDGTAAATSYANDYDLETNNAILLAEVYVPATDTTIEDAQITDKRVLFDIINPSVINPCIEEYSNHLGATDNFTETATTGNGAATADTTNHEMDLDSGVTVSGSAVFKSKSGYTLGSKPIVFNAVVDNINQGTGGSNNAFKVGLCASWTGFGNNNEISVGWSTLTGAKAITDNGGSATTTTISTLTDDDVVTIVASSSIVIFYVNGTIVATHYTNIPTSSINPGGSCGTGFTPPSVSVKISIDMFGFKRYV